MQPVTRTRTSPPIESHNGPLIILNDLLSANKKKTQQGETTLSYIKHKISLLLTSPTIQMKYSIPLRAYNGTELQNYNNLTFFLFFPFF